jgi:hypothetical protein
MTLLKNRFEELIQESLQRFCDRDNAAKIMDTYLSLIRILADHHDGAAVQAEKYWKAYQDKINPNEWIEHIQNTRKKYGTFPNNDQNDPLKEHHSNQLLGT